MSSLKKKKVILRPVGIGQIYNTILRKTLNFRNKQDFSFVVVLGLFLSGLYMLEKIASFGKKKNTESYY